MPSHNRSILCAFLLAIGLSACVKKPSQPTFGDEGFYHWTYPYKVSYSEPADKRILGEDWRLDNFVVDSKGAIKGHKEGDRYRATEMFDYDGDGKYEDVEKGVPVYDLLFKHRKKDAEIWLTTRPLSDEVSEKELRILLNNYVEAASGSTSVAVTVGAASGYAFSTANAALGEERGASVTAVSEKRFATRILNTSKATLSGVEAVAATFEIANVDQLRLSPDARWERRRVVILRPDFELVRMKTAFDGSANVPVVHRFKVLMIVGYSNQPDDFDELLPDFTKLLDSIRFLGDEQVLASLAGSIQPCLADGKGKVKVSVDPSGAIVGMDALEGATGIGFSRCASEAIKGRVFPATGERRALQLDLPAKPIAQPPGYVEEAPVEEALAEVAEEEAALEPVEEPVEGEADGAEPADDANSEEPTDSEADEAEAVDGAEVN